MYQKFLDHLQADAEIKNEFRQRLDGHEIRIVKLEGCQIAESAKVSVLGNIWKCLNQPVTAFILVAIFMAYLHFVGARI